MSRNQDSNIEMNEQCRQAFTSRIIELRVSKKLSKKSVAESIGISYSYMCKLEDGLRFPDSTVIASFAKFFDVTTDYLLGLSDQTTPLYATACFTDITMDDLGALSSKAQDEINSYIKYVIQRDGDKSGN